MWDFFWSLEEEEEGFFEREERLLDERCFCVEEASLIRPFAEEEEVVVTLDFPTTLVSLSSVSSSPLSS